MQTVIVTTHNPEAVGAPLMLDRPVPNFVARSTHGSLSSEDYRGRWMILFSHPADFTPVCTSEFIAIQRSIREFEQRQCAVVGLSIDSIYSHLAWVRNIKEKFDIEISFPIIEDISMAISTAYGMLDAASNNTSTVRAVFFIDPEGLLRAKVLYPMQVGRSVAEIIRTLTALQTVDEQQKSAPEGWQPGEKMVAKAPTTMQEADSAASVSDSAEWYYCDHTVLN